MEWHLAQPPVAAHIPSVSDLAVRAVLAGLIEDAKRLASYLVTHAETAEYKLLFPKQTVLLDYSRFFDLSRRLRDAALMNWFLTGTLDAALMTRSMEASLRSLADHRKESKERFDSMDVDGHMTIALLAGHDQEALSFFVAEDRDGEKPILPAKAKSERKVAALVAQARISQATPDPDVTKAIDRLIKSNLSGWLGSTAISLFVWLAIKETFLARTRPPLEAIAEVYQFLPGLKIPPELLPAPRPPG